MHGYGVFTWADGRKFEGYYNADKKEGPGVFYWANGTKVQGTWLKGK